MTAEDAVEEINRMGSYGINNLSKKGDWCYGIWECMVWRRWRKGGYSWWLWKSCERATIDRETGNFMFKKSVDRNSPEHKRYEIVIRGIVVDLWFYTHFEKKLPILWFGR